MVPVQNASQLIPDVHHHDLCAGHVADLGLDGLGHARVDGTTEATVGRHSDDQVLGALLLRGFDLGLLVQG